MANRFLRRHDGVVGSIPQDIEFTVQIAAAANAVDQIVWQAHVPCELVGVDATFAVTSTSGTLQVQKCPVGTAPGSGTALLASTMSLGGTAHVTVNGSLGATRSDRVFAVNDRLALDFGGTVTGLVSCNINIRLKRLQSTNSAK